jgi:hypothetical protein
MKLRRPRTIRRLTLANSATLSSVEPPFTAFLLHRHPVAAEVAERRAKPDAPPATAGGGTGRGGR